VSHAGQIVMRRHTSSCKPNYLDRYVQNRF